MIANYTAIKLANFVVKRNHRSGSVYKHRWTVIGPLTKYIQTNKKYDNKAYLSSNLIVRPLLRPFLHQIVHLYTDPLKSSRLLTFFYKSLPKRLF